MTLFVNCQNLTYSIGGKLLFKNLCLSIFSNDRIGLIGPNGCGKSSLLKLLALKETPGEGLVTFKKDLKIGYVSQESLSSTQTVKQFLIESLPSNWMDYEKENQLESWLEKLQFFDEKKSLDQLSGGWKKRIQLIQAFMKNPDLVLLDEPTNHLDLEGIFWLESFLKQNTIPYLLVSHDRIFLEHTVNRIVEINRIYPNSTFAIDGPYSYFLEKKEEFIAGQIQQQQSLKSKVRKEVEWLRTTPQARTTKSRARTDQAHSLIEQLYELKTRNQTKKPHLEFNASKRETNKLLSAHNLSKTMGDRLLFEHVNLTLSPGTRIGLMGPNGSGKTTLLKILSGDIQADQGTLKKADQLKYVYFDQHRKRLPEDWSLRQALSPKGDYVHYQGKDIHVHGWCKRFLFSPDRLDMAIKTLSGGEKARISIAHLMLQPADLLFLDEPTNDLDIPTLEILEETLCEFPGAIVLITHDRFMLERICTGILSLGDSKPKFYASYNKWEEYNLAIEKPVIISKSINKPSFTYQEQKEYSQIEQKILKLEEKINQLYKLLEDVKIQEQPHQLEDLCSQIAAYQIEIEKLYLRWNDLDQKLRISKEP